MQGFSFNKGGRDRCISVSSRPALAYIVMSSCPAGLLGEIGSKKNKTKTKN
jgi:hypothetical protein